jgi:hypothetical protein
MANTLRFQKGIWWIPFYFSDMLILRAYFRVGSRDYAHNGS